MDKKRTRHDCHYTNTNYNSMTLLARQPPTESGKPDDDDDSTQTARMFRRGKAASHAHSSSSSSPSPSPPNARKGATPPLVGARRVVFILVVYPLLFGAFILWKLRHSRDKEQSGSRVIPSDAPRLRDDHRESADPWIVHRAHPSNNKLFYTVEAYLFDGDAAARPGPQRAMDDLMVAIVGVGDFTKRPQSHRDEAAGIAPRVPSSMKCVFTDTDGAPLETMPAMLHVNGTAYEGAIRGDGYVRYFGERLVWITCGPLSPRLAENGVDALRVRLLDDSIDFDSLANLPLVNVVSSRDGVPPKELTLCVSAIYGLRGTQWLIEFIEYHRAIGFDSIELYVDDDVSEAVRVVIEHYRAVEGLVRAHDWGSLGAFGRNGVGGGVPNVNWEHAQRLSRNDCYFRNRGRSRWIGFNDLDEFFTPGEASTSEGASLTRGDFRATVLRYCEDAYRRDPNRIACSLESVTVPPVAGRASDLILDRIIVSEMRCQEPYNCGLFHKGRSKYLLRTARGSLNPGQPLFYHAVNQNYDFALRLHTIVPSQSIGYVRHYAGHFRHSRAGGLPANNRRENPLPAFATAAMRRAIYENPRVRVLYEASAGEKETFLKLYDIENAWRFAKPEELAARPTDAGERASREGGRRFLTFEQFGGRLNNQIWTLDWVFRLSLALNRTVVIPTPLQLEHWIGFPTSLEELANPPYFFPVWNLTMLRASFDFVFDFELFGEEKALVTSGDVPVRCAWKFGEGGENKYVARWAHAAEVSGLCHRRIHFHSGEGLVHPYKCDTRVLGVDPLAFWRAMRPSDALLETPRAFLARERISPGGFTGLHARTWRESNGNAEHALKVCRRLSGKLLDKADQRVNALHACGCVASIVPRRDFAKTVWKRANLDATCELTKETSFRAVLGRESGEPLGGGSLVVATDHETKEIDAFFERMGARMFYYRGSEIESRVRNACGTRASWRGRRLVDLVESILPALLDMTLMTLSGTFFGTPSSTLSQAICMWRFASATNSRGDYPDDFIVGGMLDTRPDLCSLVYLATFTNRCDEMQRERFACTL